MQSQSINKLAIFAVLVLLGSVFALINLSTPIIGDAWYPRTFGKENTGNAISGWFLASKGYVRGYFLGNPRIGQFWLIFSGYNPFTYVFVISVFSVLYIALLGMLVMGRDSFRSSWRTLLTGLIAFAIVWYIDRAIGPIFFYQATSSNYLFATVLLLSFLLAYRIGLLGGSAPDAMKRLWFIVPFTVMSFFAGMAHETFGPPMIAVLLLLIGTEIMLRKQPPLAWQIASTAAYVIGYMAIFFAPGQDKRYTASRYDGIPRTLDDLVNKLGDLADLYLGNGLIIGIIVIGIALWRFRDWRHLFDLYAASLFGLILSVGFVATAIASPLLGERLAFASHTLMGVVAAMVLTRFVTNRMWFATLCVASGIYFVIEHRNVVGAYNEYRSQFDRQAQAVEAGISKGETQIVAPAYSISFYDLKKYIYREFPQSGANAKINAVIARYYGVQSFAVVPPASLVAYSGRFRDAGTVMRFTENCPATDRDGWTGTGDPMGTLVCGEDYAIRFDSENSVWVVSGLREVDGAIFSLREATYETKGPPPESGELRIWGGAYTFDERGYLYSTRGERVGRINDPHQPQ